MTIDKKNRDNLIRYRLEQANDTIVYVSPQLNVLLIVDAIF